MPSHRDATLATLPGSPTSRRYSATSPRSRPMWYWRVPVSGASAWVRPVNASSPRARARTRGSIRSAHAHGPRGAASTARSAARLGGEADEREAGAGGEVIRPMVEDRRLGRLEFRARRPEPDGREAAESNGREAQEAGSEPAARVMSIEMSWRLGRAHGDCNRRRG